MGFLKDVDFGIPSTRRGIDDSWRSGSDYPIDIAPAPAVNEEALCTECYVRPATDDFRLCDDCEAERLPIPPMTASIAAARRIWHGSHDNQIEIDDNEVKTSRDDDNPAGGCWVSAWVWVYDSGIIDADRGIEGEENEIHTRETGNR